MSVTNSAAKMDAPTVSPPSLEAMELLAQSTYRPPGPVCAPPREVEWVRNTDGTPLIDHRGRPVTVDRMLATKPLRGELCSRPGPGNRKLTYLSGEGVTRTLNDIFGFDGWNLDIKNTQREECVKDDKDRFHVAYTATVRLTHRKSGAYKEDCGAGDCVDRSMGTAVANALKASITDAMKRAARHFGDKLGNSLYQGNLINKAPNSLKEALDQYDIERANTKFGFPKDNPLPAKSTAEIAENIGITLGSTIPASAIKAGIPSSHPPSTGLMVNRLKAPVPSFHSNPVATPVHLTTHVISQTPSGPRPVPPLVNDGAKQAPSQPRAQPPPTPNQGLQSSGLFSGLSVFAAGNNKNVAMQSEARPVVENVIHTENIPPIDFDELDMERPGTSTGLKSSDPRAPQNAGMKRTLEAADNQIARKMPSLNPYARGENA